MSSAGRSHQTTDLEGRSPEEKKIINERATKSRRKWQKSMALLLGAMSFLETIIVVTVIVKPVPQFSLSGNLLYIQSLKADQYTKRDNVVQLPQVWTAIVPARPGRQNLVHRADKPTLVDAGAFVAMWIGAMGACLQRASSSIVCTGGLSANLHPMFQQSGLPEAVVKMLPSSLGGAGLGYLIGALLHAAFIVYLPLVTMWERYMWSPYPKATSWEKRYQFVLATSSLLALGGVAAFTITTIQLRASLSRAVKSLPALDPDLTVKWDGGFEGLYASSILGGVLIVCCVFLTSWVREPKKSARDQIIARAGKSNFGLTDKIDSRSVIAGSDAGSELSNMPFNRR